MTWREKDNMVGRLIANSVGTMALVVELEKAQLKSLIKLKRIMT